jgi:ferredoxin
MSERLRVNPILCDAYGQCAELLPELIALDEWGYPIIDPRPIQPELRKAARRAVAMCPRLALSLGRDDDAPPPGPLGRARPLHPLRSFDPDQHE